MKRLITIGVCLAVIVMIAALRWLSPTQTDALSSSNNSDTTVGANEPVLPANTSKPSTTQSAANPPTLVSPPSLAAADITPNTSASQVLSIGEPVAFETVRQKLWIPVSEEEAADRLFLLYDIQPLYDKKIGDKVNFQANKFGINHTGTITQVEQVDDDIQRWIGSFDGLPTDRYRFRITQSQQDNYALATLYTEKGIYELESKDGVGWLRSSDFINDDSLHNDSLHNHDHNMGNNSSM